MPSLLIREGRRADGRPATTSGAMILCLVAVVAAACTSGPSAPVDERPYAERIQADRDHKDQYFKTAEDSPILAAERATFSGLPYFPVDASYRVPAALREERRNPPVIILMATSRDQPRRMQHVGTLEFTFQGQPLTLSAFVEEGQSLARLFVPFGDLTNGLETYNAGSKVTFGANDEDDFVEVPQSRKRRAPVQAGAGLAG